MENEESLDSIKARVLEKMKDDVVAAEFRMSLFVSALESYRHDSVLRPYPSLGMTEDGNKNVQLLTTLCSSVPRFAQLLDGKSASLEGWKLLDWVFSKTFDIKSLNKSKFQDIERKTGHSSFNSTSPDFIFEIEYHNSNTLNTKFLALADEYEVLYAYHGSSLENFHSILHNGLHSHLNKNSLFGEGTYLSSDLNVSIMYSKYVTNWSKCSLGDKLSCVAVCEVLNHPDVKCSLEDPTKAQSDSRRSSTGSRSSSAVGSRARARNSEAGDVPDRYYVVQNNQLLRVKYLLVYAERWQHVAQRASPGTWFARILVLYIVGLVLLGLSRTSLFHKLTTRYFKEQTEL